MANVLVLDTETYGAVKRGVGGVALPEQRLFHPKRMMVTDGCPRNQLVQTVGLTPLRTDDLAKAEPGASMCLVPSSQEHMRLLCEWLMWADTIVGQNIGFDVKVLREAFPQCNRLLDGRRHKLIEVMVLQYLSSEVDEGRSLKDMGPAHGLYKYETTLKGGRFEGLRDPRLSQYQCEDTHNTTLAAAHFIDKLTNIDPRLTEQTLDMYNGLLWGCIRMEEAGYPVSASGLTGQHEEWMARLEELRTELEDEHDLLVDGPGSQKPRYEVIESMFADVKGERVRELFGVDDVMDLSNPRKPKRGTLELTEKQKKISYSITNRNLLSHLLPEDSPHRKTLELWNEHTKLSKLVSSYTQPLLYHKTSSNCKHPEQTKLLDMGDPDTLLGFPSIYVVPMSFDGDEEGGQIQGRISFKDPATQTFPKPIKKHTASRFPRGCIGAWDFSQLELRVAGVLTGDPFFLEAYTMGKDLHTAEAVAIFGKDNLDKKYAHLSEAERYNKDVNKAFGDYERQAGKGTNFAKGYMSSAMTMQNQLLKKANLLIPLDVLQRSVDLRPELTPKLCEWQDRMIFEARTKRRIVLPLTGQQRTFLGGHAHTPTEMVNFPIQCTASNLVSFLIGYAHRHLPSLAARRPPYLFQCTHDSMMFDCKTEQQKQDVQEVLDAGMEWLVTDGYWAQLIDIYGHYCPLVLETD